MNTSSERASALEHSGERIKWTKNPRAVQKIVVGYFTQLLDDPGSEVDWTAVHPDVRREY